MSRPRTQWQKYRRREIAKIKKRIKDLSAIVEIDPDTPFGKELAHAKKSALYFVTEARRELELFTRKRKDEHRKKELP